MFFHWDSLSWESRDMRQLPTTFSLFKTQKRAQSRKKTRVKERESALELTLESLDLPIPWSSWLSKLLTA